MNGDVIDASFRRLRNSWWPVVQAAAAAGLAWYITHDALGHPQPFFAPIAAAISLSATVGRRWRNAVQMIFGVALGIAVSDAVVQVFGTGVLPLTGVVLVTMAAAVLFSPVPMFVNQAANAQLPERLAGRERRYRGQQKGCRVTRIPLVTPRVAAALDSVADFAALC